MTVTNVGRGCGGRGSVGRVDMVAGRVRFGVRERPGRADERRCCVRKNRVGLTPQWSASSLAEVCHPNRALAGHIREATEA